MHEIAPPIPARAHLGTEPALEPIAREGRGILIVTGTLAVVSIAATIAAVVAL